MCSENLDAFTLGEEGVAVDGGDGARSGGEVGDPDFAPARRSRDRNRMRLIYSA